MFAVITQLTIIGVGLIGGSLARALRRAGACQRIVGCGRRQDELDKAVELGVIDRYELDVAAAVREADMIVVAVPLGAMESIFRAMAGHVRPDTVITDVGSTKTSVIDAARNAFGALPPGFVPGHPIAGTERSGVEASFAELYQGRRVILTPVPESSDDAIARVRAMWALAGAQVETMDAAHHDEVLAATSHLPHLLAFGLVDALLGLDETEEIFRFAASGFRDFTRIASSDPVMWRDICLANRDALLAMLSRYQTEVAILQQLIAAGDGENLQALFTRAKTARDRYIQQLR